MSILPTQINIAELDFDQILTNLVEFMKTDPTFADYDFSGSGLRLLARVLSYVTFYNGYYLSAAMNESFIDSAQLRSSVVSHARMLGYIAHGVQSARLFSNVAMQLSGTSALSLSLPKKTQFQLSSNSDMSFYTLQDVEFTANANSGLFEATNVELVEGTPLGYQFTVDVTNPTQRFIIPNANIDYSTISVRVKASAGSNTIQNFVRANNFLTIGPTDSVFFTQESYNAFPELKFGNGVVGAPLSQGNVILVDYFISRGPMGNGIRGPFKIVNPTLNGFVQGASITDANTQPSSGGSGPEDIDQVRFLAPNQYQAQNRCVTVEDYKTVILKEYGENIGTINVFGGEQGDPNDIKERPILGRVFIAVKPKLGLQFTEITRSFIENQIVKPRSVVGIIPQVIDPDYTFIVCSTLVKYDQHDTALSKLDLQNAIIDNILTYSINNIEKFDTAFRFSRLTRVIDDTDESILSSLTRLDLEKRFFPKLGVPNQFILKFGVPVRKLGNESVVLESISHRFNYTKTDGSIQENCFLSEDDGQLVVAFRDSNNNVQIIKREVGTVDIQKGLVTINNFVPLSIEGGESDIRVRLTPRLNDFMPRLNQLFTMDTTDVNVFLVNENTILPDAQVAFFQGGIL